MKKILKIQEKKIKRYNRVLSGLLTAEFIGNKNK